MEQQVATFAVLVLIICPIVFGSILNHLRIKKIKRTYVKGNCCCSVVQHTGNYRELNEYYYRDGDSNKYYHHATYKLIFDYYLNNQKYQVSRNVDKILNTGILGLFMNKPPLKQGDFIEIYVNPTNYNDVFLPKFDKDWDKKITRAMTIYLIIAFSIVMITLPFLLSL